jgi:hypothetical protein
MIKFCALADVAASKMLPPSVWEKLARGFGEFEAQFKWQHDSPMEESARGTALRYAVYDKLYSLGLRDSAWAVYTMPIIPPRFAPHPIDNWKVEVRWSGKVAYGDPGPISEVRTLAERFNKKEKKP